METLIRRLIKRAGSLIANDGLADLKSDGQAASARLRSGGRTPINIWGDVMLDGSDPQIRRVVTGKDGHESLLSFFYLNEILTLNEIVKAIPEREALPGWPVCVTARYKVLKEATSDPQNHVSDEILSVFLPTALYFKLIGQENTELCELGCTFFSAVDKMKICSSLIDGGLNFTKIKCSAVDHSDFFLRGARMFHEGDNLVEYLDYADWAPSTPYPFHLSRFVASYAVDSTEKFAEWMTNFSAFHIIDVVNIAPEDFETSNNGLKQIFFNFPKLMGHFDKAGWNVYLNDIAADFNSGQRCAVVKLFGIRSQLDERLGFAEKVRSYSDVARILPMDKLSESAAAAVLKRVLDSYSPPEWDALAEYKKHFPIWGKPMRELHSMDDVNNLIRKPQRKLKLEFSSGQINYYVREALGEL